MKRHCFELCFASVIAVNIAMPFIECKIHEHCHLHPDEPAPKVFQINYPGTVNASGATTSIFAGTNNL